MPRTCNVFKAETSTDKKDPVEDVEEKMTDLTIPKDTEYGEWPTDDAIHYLTLRRRI